MKVYLNLCYAVEVPDEVCEAYNRIGKTDDELRASAEKIEDYIQDNIVNNLPVSFDKDDWVVDWDKTERPSTSSFYVT